MKTSRKHSIAVGVCLLTAAATALPLSSAAGATAALPAAGGATTVLPGLGDAVDTLARTLDTRAVDRPVLPTAAAKNALTALLSRSGAGTRATWDERFGTLRSVRGPTTADRARHRLRASPRPRPGCATTRPRSA